MELLVPTISDIIFKYTWLIKDYKQTIAKNNIIDSPTFDLNVNGILSTWNLSIRFWKNPEGKRVTNPIVLCLSILNCSINEVEQAKIRFQFAVFNAELNNWEYCHFSRTTLELKSTSEIISLGYRDLLIVDRHLKNNDDVMIMVKIQIIQYENDKQCLTQDIARVPKYSSNMDANLTCTGEGQEEMSSHANVAVEHITKSSLNMTTNYGEHKDDFVHETH